MTGRSIRDVFNQFEANKGSGNVTFFKLQQDREKAFVRFLHNGEEDLEWYVVHETMIAGRKSLVKCLEGPNCPACNSGNRSQLKVFLQLLQQGDAPGVIRVWERGQTFIPKILSFLERNPTLVGQVVEIERLGRANDTNTQYNLYPKQLDGMTLANLPPRNQLLGPDGHVLDKSEAEMSQLFAPQQRVGGTYRDGGAPQQQWGAPQQQPPQQNWGAPQQQAPAQNWGAPQQQQQPPAQNWGAPQQQAPQQPAQNWGTTSPQDNGLPFPDVQQQAPQQQPPTQQPGPGADQGTHKDIF